ncbi:MAG: deoxynucleoside kinase [Clostridia bacterium]|nr:deoxynucleoside kinase [Clostridia bacterium]
MKGKLIVIEGLDGSGKSTQINRLCEALIKKGITDFKQIKLPDYENDSSALVRMYLNGDFGKLPEDVNAYAASSFYAVDRFANYKAKWKSDYDNGTIILADRYTTSNAYHQATKLPEGEWNEYFAWLEDFEYNKLAIPKPDAVIYLDMPIEISQKMMTSRYSGDESKKDIHEANTNYLAQCRVAAKAAAKAMDWHVINCSENDQPRSIDAIGDEIENFVSKFIF